MRSDTDEVSSPVEQGVDGAHKRRLGPLVPVLVFMVLVAFLAIGLTLNPRELPSPLIGKAVPTFDLPPVKGRQAGLSSANLGAGEVSLVNVFASWCVACRVEHPLLMDLQASGRLAIHGLNYKDEPDDAERWLAEWGDPYTRTGADVDGRVAIDWGVYGVPETFLIGPDGRIAHKHIGPMSAEFISKELLPMVERLRATGKP